MPKRFATDGEPGERLLDELKYKLFFLNHVEVQYMGNNKKQEKVLLWYNLIGQTTIERRTNSCARIIPQKHTIVNVCSSTEGNMGEPKRR